MRPTKAAMRASIILLARWGTKDNPLLDLAEDNHQSLFVEWAVVG